MRQLALEIAAPALPTLDNFIAGSNVELVERLRRLAAGPVPERFSPAAPVPERFSPAAPVPGRFSPAAPAPERFIYLWGAPGCGRSHLLKGALHAMRGAGLAAAHVSCAPG